MFVGVSWFGYFAIVVERPTNLNRMLVPVHQFPPQQQQSEHDSDTTTSSIPTNISEDVLPTWMTDYFQWHNESLNLLNQDYTQWKNYQYLVVRCLEMDNKCGGASDRLQSIPLALLMAAKYKRLLFIEWEKPAPLTEFLVPVVMDWTIPDWLQRAHSVHDGKIKRHEPHLFFQRSPAIVSDKHWHRLEDHQETIMLDMRYQSTDQGRDYYNKHRIGEPDFDQVYSQLWTSLFRPAPAVQNRIDETKLQLNLSTVPYNSLHI